MGYAQLLKGESLIAKKNFLLADTTLKVALPALRGERGLESAALFQLGIANHEVAKLSKNKARAKEAIDFYSRAADVNQDFRVLASQRISELTRTFNIK